MVHTRWRLHAQQTLRVIVVVFVELPPHPYMHEAEQGNSRAAITTMMS